MEEIEEFNVCPHYKTNFVCKLVQGGNWKEEGIGTKNKWIFTIRPKNEKIDAPTFGDQRNFFMGLFEAEWRNDNYVFSKNGKKYARPPQRYKKIDMFINMLEEIKEKWGDQHKGLSYYIEMEEE